MTEATDPSARDRYAPLDSGELLDAAAQWKREGRSVALATVISTWGSSPRPAGSMLAVDGDSRILGSVSGGCVEGAVVQEALEIMKDGRPRVLEFGVSDEDAWSVGLACGGTVRVYVERLEDG
ncbi:XdhC family protein [Ectothiorhodospiraceae bacterium WFHF3C12]|nr:XdhC family protein [Ectothiorhodospiraceae bacterium WFHF3C12]